MKFFTYLFSAFVLLTLSTGCAVSSSPIVLYDQTKFSKDQVVTLLPASNQGIYMVLIVDGKTAGGSCFTNCMFMEPVQISPGRHEFRTGNMQVPGYTGINSTVTFNFEAELEAGKTYELQVKPIKKNKGQQQEFEIAWQQVNLP